MVAGGDPFITPPLWHPSSVAVLFLSCPSLCVGTVVVPFSFRENSCHAILYPVGVFHDMCCTHSVLLLYADGATLCVPYSTLPYSLLWGCSPTLLYVRLTLHNPILGCGHTLSLRRCGDCLIRVFLILYLYNVVSGDCGPHFVFTPRILRVTWVSKPLLTLPLLFITTTRHYHYMTLHNLPTLPLLSLHRANLCKRGLLRAYTVGFNYII